MEVTGQRLKLLRKEAGKTQKQIGELLGVTERHYRLCEAGKVDLPSSKIILLADYFGVTTDYLLGRSEEWR